jgi:DNA polymerase
MYDKRMTAEQKMRAAQFLDLAGGYLRSGYKRLTLTYQFTDDQSAVPASPTLTEGRPAIPNEQAIRNGPADVSLAPTEQPQSASCAQPASGPFPQSAGYGQPGGAGALESIAASIRACTNCALHTTRVNTVPGEGVAAPLVMVIGKGPDENSDNTGRPFVGDEGTLLDKMLAAIELSREKNCFVTNVVKCRLPYDRDPLPGEVAACAPFLAAQIALLRPRVILCAGRVATQTLLKTTNDIKNLHGYFIDCTDIPLFPIYHPSTLLHDTSLKRPMWDDLKTLRERLQQF